MSTYELIEDQFTVSRQYAEEAFELLTNANDGYLKQIEQAVTGNDVPAPVIDSVNYDWPEPAMNINIIANRPEPPSDSDLVISSPDQLVLPTFTSVDIPEIPDIPTLRAIEPVISLPTSPEFELPTDPGDVPTVYDPVDPTKPAYEIPDVPSITFLDIPSFQGISLPQFTAVEPTIDINPISNTFVYSEETYSSELLTQLRENLLSDLVNGGTGLGATVEEALWNRAKARTALENARAREQMEDGIAARGWTLPPGALQAAIAEAITEETRALSDINEKIMIEQARLAQEWSKLSLTAAIELESKTMDYTSSVATRTLEAAKAAIQAAIDVFNAQVAYHNLQLEIYKTTATVYETRIRAALLVLEEYKARIDAVKSYNEVQGLKIQLFNSQVSAVQSLIDLYKAEVQAAAIKADMNKTRIDAYKSKVEAYGVKVQAKTAEFNAYQAKIAGETSKVQLFSEQVRAYATQVEATKSHIDAQKSGVEMQIMSDKMKLDAFLGDVERYKAELTKNTADVEAIIKSYGMDVELYNADVKAAEVDMSGQVEIYKGRVQQAKNQTDLLLEEAKANLEAFIRNRDLVIEALKGGVTACAQLVASSLSAVNAGVSGGWSSSYSYDETKAIPTTQNIHTWDETGA